MNKKSAIVIGAGIVGLATARKLALKGYKVQIFEQYPKALGASIRNFGMIWPIGQPTRNGYERALKSKETWKEICSRANIWHEEKGSLHLAYHHDEWEVLQEFYEVEKNNRPLVLVKPGDIDVYSSVVNSHNLIGGLFSADEMIVEAREAIAQIALFLQEQHSVTFYWGKKITDIKLPTLFSGKEKFEADEVFICSGQDFESLYPEVFIASGITKCKLQMMRLAAQPERIGASLCGGLSLTHYNSFQVAKSLSILKKRIKDTMPKYVEWGIHVMIAQNAFGEITLGDSHEYGLDLDPFGRDEADKLILDYLKTFTQLQNTEVIQHWTGIYPKLLNGEPALILEPQPGVTIINGLGGAGMTLSFGLLDEYFDKK